MDEDSRRPAKLPAPSGSGSRYRQSGRTSPAGRRHGTQSDDGSDGYGRETSHDSAPLVLRDYPCGAVTGFPPPRPRPGSQTGRRWRDGTEPNVRRVRPGPRTPPTTRRSRTASTRVLGPEFVAAAKGYQRLAESGRLSAALDRGCSVLRRSRAGAGQPLIGRYRLVRPPLQTRLALPRPAWANASRGRSGWPPGKLLSPHPTCPAVGAGRRGWYLPRRGPAEGGPPPCRKR